MAYLAGGAKGRSFHKEWSPSQKTRGNVKAGLKGGAIAVGTAATLSAVAGKSVKDTPKKYAITAAIGAGAGLAIHNRWVPKRHFGTASQVQPVHQVAPMHRPHAETFHATHSRLA